MSQNDVGMTQQSDAHQILLKSRWAVRVIVGLTSIIAGYCLVMFSYQLWAPRSDTSFLQRDDPLFWMYLLAHLIRGSVATWLMISAWSYLRELRRVHKNNSADYRPVFVAVSRGWYAISCSAIILLSIHVLLVFESLYGFSNIPLPVSRKITNFAPAEKYEVKVEFREANYEPQVAWIESSMTVMQPVKKPVYLRDSVIIDESDIVRAATTRDYNGNPAVAFSLSKEGADKMLAWSTAMVDKHLAIIVNGVVIQVAVVRSPISSSIQLTGSMTEEQAQDIADSINGK